VVRDRHARTRRSPDPGAFRETIDHL
jgi:hypothetical protein